MIVHEGKGQLDKFFIITLQMNILKLTNNQVDPFALYFET